MTFRHSMTSFTTGIRVRAPLHFRMLDGMVADHWQAEGSIGAGGYYLAPDPRIVIFLNDVGGAIRMADRQEALGQNCRPMGRAFYMPAGMPIWSHFTSAHQFQHLDLHLDARMLQGLLAPRLGSSAALTAIRTPVVLEDAPAVDTLARLMADELGAVRRHDLYAESLARAIITGMMDITEPAPQQGGLTPAQMKRLQGFVQDNLHRRLSNAELAEQCGLSESWFSHVFKQTNAETPQVWQARLRIARAQQALSQSSETLSRIADSLGFADQAHLTRVFRQHTGQTPAAWRRNVLAQ
ncbi:AraC family transcriptional regulator [Gemmobacter serpentinus]|uniref:AraC family transcriptional regulator n=1 Tax=Gemmobacter serpentinus TaxID=2652247 RepID=UPI00124D1AF3|nr:AraC family transcriptional regulator [Gemmobacter serpentinus]